jgi:hypothetical protein
MNNRLRLLGICLLMFLAAGVWLLPTHAERSATTVGRGQTQVGKSLTPSSARAVGFAESRPARELGLASKDVDRTLIKSEDEEGLEINEQNTREARRTAPDSLLRPSRDAALPSNPLGPPNIPSPSLTFDGIASDDNFVAFGFQFVPPDTNGDVGPNHYVMSVNLLVRVYDKNGVPLIPPFKQSSLFAPLGGACAQFDRGDPVTV